MSKTLRLRLMKLIVEGNEGDVENLLQEMRSASSIRSIVNNGRIWKKLLDDATVTKIETPLARSIKSKKPGIFKVLLKYGANPNSKCFLGFGETFQHPAVALYKKIKSSDIFDDNTRRFCEMFIALAMCPSLSISKVQGSRFTCKRLIRRGEKSRKSRSFATKERVLILNRINSIVNFVRSFKKDSRQYLPNCVNLSGLRIGVFGVRVMIHLIMTSKKGLGDSKYSLNLSDSALGEASCRSILESEFLSRFFFSEINLSHNKAGSLFFAPLVRQLLKLAPILPNLKLDLSGCFISDSILKSLTLLCKSTPFSIKLRKCKFESRKMINNMFFKGSLLHHIDISGNLFSFIDLRAMDKSLCSLKSDDICLQTIKCDIAGFSSRLEVYAIKHCVGLLASTLFRLGADFFVGGRKIEVKESLEMRKLFYSVENRVKFTQQSKLSDKVLEMIISEAIDRIHVGSSESICYFSSTYRNKCHHTDIFAPKKRIICPFIVAPRTHRKKAFFDLCFFENAVSGINVVLIPQFSAKFAKKRDEYDTFTYLSKAKRKIIAVKVGRWPKFKKQSLKGLLPTKGKFSTFIVYYPKLNIQLNLTEKFTTEIFYAHTDSLALACQKPFETVHFKIETIRNLELKRGRFQAFDLNIITQSGRCMIGKKVHLEIAEGKFFSPYMTNRGTFSSNHGVCLRIAELFENEGSFSSKSYLGITGRQLVNKKGVISSRILYLGVENIVSGVLSACVSAICSSVVNITSIVEVSNHLKILSKSALCVKDSIRVGKNFDNSLDTDTGIDIFTNTMEILDNGNIQSAFGLRVIVLDHFCIANGGKLAARSVALRTNSCFLSDSTVLFHSQLLIDSESRIEIVKSKIKAVKCVPDDFLRFVETNFDIDNQHTLPHTDMPSVIELVTKENVVIRDTNIDVQTLFFKGVGSASFGGETNMKLRSGFLNFDSILDFEGIWEVEKSLNIRHQGRFVGRKVGVRAPKFNIFSKAPRGIIDIRCDSVFDNDELLLESSDVLLRRGALFSIGRSMQSNCKRFILDGAITKKREADITKFTVKSQYTKGSGRINASKVELYANQHGFDGDISAESSVIISGDTILRSPRIQTTCNRGKILNGDVYLEFGEFGEVTKPIKCARNLLIKSQHDSRVVFSADSVVSKGLTSITGGSLEIAGSDLVSRGIELLFLNEIEHDGKIAGEFANIGSYNPYNGRMTNSITTSEASCVNMSEYLHHTAHQVNLHGISRAPDIYVKCNHLFLAGESRSKCSFFNAICGNVINHGNIETTARIKFDSSKVELMGGEWNCPTGEIEVTCDSFSSDGDATVNCHRFTLNTKASGRVEHSGAWKMLNNGDNVLPGKEAGVFVYGGGNKHDISSFW